MDTSNGNGFKLKWIVAGLTTASSLVGYVAGRYPPPKDDVMGAAVASVVKQREEDRPKIAKIDLLEQKLETIDRNTQDLPAIKTDLAVLKNNVQRLVDKKP